MRWLLVELVVIVFVVCDLIDECEFASLLEFVLGGLVEEDARILLAIVILGWFDERVCDRLIVEVCGNLFVIFELLCGLAVMQLLGGFGL